MYYMKHEAFLKENYVKYGPEWCSKKINISYATVKNMASKLKLRIKKPRWSKKEDEFLLKYLNDYGSKYCSEKLNRSRIAITSRGRFLNCKEMEDKTSKFCRSCETRKSLSDFSPNKVAKFGVQNRCKKCHAKWESNRKKTDKDYRLQHSIRNRIRMAIKKNVKSGKSLDLLGCDIYFFKKYISNMFKPGMTWENHGEWHLDHIRPCCTFDLSKPEEQQECFHYTNMQPLWKKENLRKAKKCNIK